jgi:O-antigen/teichoic acid export membrane protein
LLDQGLFALSNFVVNVVLARWLTPEDYGGFTIAYSIFLMLGTIHTALLAEPMIVFGAGKYRERLSHYLGLLMRGHWLLTAGASATLAVTAVGLYLVGQKTVGLAVLALAVVNPFILQLWLVRRICYIRDKPHLAASGGLFYMTVLTAGAYLLAEAEWLSSPSALLLMGGGSLAAALWIRYRLPSESYDRSPEFRRNVTTQHWEYGRWAVGTGVFGAIVLNLYYIVIPARHGLEGTATLKALMNLMMPALQSFLALWVVALPRFVRVRDTPAFIVLVRRLLIFCCAAALLNWLALGLSHAYVVRTVYDGAYAGQSHLLWILGLVPVAYAAIAVLENALRSLERSDEVFRAYVLSTVSTCVIGISLTLVWGPGGAILGLLISTGLAVFSMAWSLRTQIASSERGA